MNKLVLTAMVMCLGSDFVAVARADQPGRAPAGLDLQMVKAARNGDVEAVKRFLQGGANIEAEGDNGETALVQAAEQGQVEVVRLLLEKGARTEYKSASGTHHSAVSWALGRCHPEVVKLLLAKGAKPEGGMIIGAAGCGLPELVTHCLERGENIESRGSGGVTPLLHASGMGNIRQCLPTDPGPICHDGPEVVRLLLDKGANIEARSHDGTTPLMNAAFWGNTEVVKLLLAKKARQDAKNDLGQTAAMIAIGRKHADVAELLGYACHSVGQGQTVCEPKADSKSRKSKSR